MSDITNDVEACPSCQQHQASQQQEPIPSDPPPTRIFEDVSADLFSLGKAKYLVYSDWLSGWPTIDRWQHDPSSREVIRAISRNFVDLGVPVRFRSDNGPQFASTEFKKFLIDLDVSAAPSTPHYRQSNGHAEAAVKAMKNLIMKTSPSGHLEEEAFRQALLEWRNTPREDGMSPAQRVFGQPTRSIHRPTIAHSPSNGRRPCGNATRRQLDCEPARISDTTPSPRHYPN